MAKKKKSKIAKALKTIIPLLGVGAVLAGRGRSGGGDPNMIRGVTPMNTGNLDNIFTVDDMMIQEGGTGISPFAAAKGGRAGYKKGGKVARGCGKIMAGRSKKTKYI
jgi:hypothetical protein